MIRIGWRGGVTSQARRSSNSRGVRISSVRPSMVGLRRRYARCSSSRRPRRSWASGGRAQSHFRTSDNKEVDFVLERADGSLAAVEVKTADHVSAQGFAGLKTLARVVGLDFVCGVVLYGGREVVPFAENLFAVPHGGLPSQGRGSRAASEYALVLRDLDSDPSTPIQHDDLTNNCWGTTDPDSVAAWIGDVNDDPGDLSYLGIVDFEPFLAERVPVRKTSLSHA